MSAYLKKNIFFLLLIVGMIAFYWIRYRTAPNIEFAKTKATDLSGREFFLGDALKKPTVLHFYASWCGPCLKELRTLNNRVAQLNQEGIQLVLVTDDTPEKINSIAQQLPPEVLFYKVNKLTELGIHTIPTSYFIDGNGMIKKKVVDTCNWENDDFCNEIISLIK